MSEIVIDGKGQVAADSSRSGFDGIRCTHHGSDGFNSVCSGDSHANDRAARQIVTHVLEEGPLLMFSIVLFYGGSFSLDKFEAGDFQPTGFDSPSYFSNQVSGDPARFDKHKCRFVHGGRGYRWDSFNHWSTKAVWGQRPSWGRQMGPVALNLQP